MTARRQLGDRAAELRHAFDRLFAQPARPDADPSDDFLAIRIAAQPYALRCAEIAALYADKAVTPVPSRSAALHGIGGFRGAVVPVYSLAALLGHPMGPVPRWIVIAAGLSAAFAFEALDGSLRVRRDAILPRAGDERSDRHVRGFVREPDRSLAIVHLPAVLETVRQAPGSVAGEER